MGFGAVLEMVEVGFVVEEVLLIAAAIDEDVDDIVEAIDVIAIALAPVNRIVSDWEFDTHTEALHRNSTRSSLAEVDLRI